MQSGKEITSMESGVLIASIMAFFFSVVILFQVFIFGPQHFHLFAYTAHLCLHAVFFAHQNLQHINHRWFKPPSDRFNNPAFSESGSDAFSVSTNCALGILMSSVIFFFGVDGFAAYWPPYKVVGFWGEKSSYNPTIKFQSSSENLLWTVCLTPASQGIS